MFEESLIERIKELVGSFLEMQNIELVELSLHRQGKNLLLRFLVEKKGGITLDDCVFLNQEIGAILDRHPDLIEESYILEVSSPGLDRPLITERDFVRNLGKKIRVLLKNEYEEKYEYKGEIYDVVKGNLLLKKNSGEIISIPLENIQKGEQIF